MNTIMEIAQWVKSDKPVDKHGIPLDLILVSAIGNEYKLREFHATSLKTTIILLDLTTLEKVTIEAVYLDHYTSFNDIFKVKK